MADAKLTALTAASALAAADLFYVSQSAASRKATGTQLLALVGTTYVPLAGGTMSGALTIASGTLTSSAPALNITQTWNNAGVQFNALLINATDSASSSISTFFEMQIAGTVRHLFTKGGRYTGASAVLAGPGASSGITSTGVAINNFVVGIRNSSLAELSWTSGNLNGTVDVALYRDAAATLAQRNGTTAQRMHIYRSYTDGSNYSRLALGWNTSTALLMAEGLGTGTDGNVAFNDAALATGATLGYIMVPSAAGISTGVPADIPAGQTPIVFDSTNKKIGAYTGGAWVWTAALA